MGNDSYQSVCKEIRLDFHVEEPCNAAGSVIGVERGKNQVAGNGGSDGDICRFLVAHFADHDDIGVLTQYGAQGGGESESGAVIYLHLIDAFNGVFYRILNRDDIYCGLIYFLKERIQSGGFTASGRAGKQNDAVRLFEEAVDEGIFFRSKAEIFARKGE